MNRPCSSPLKCMGKMKVQSQQHAHLIVLHRAVSVVWKEFRELFVSVVLLLFAKKSAKKTGNNALINSFFFLIGSTLIAGRTPVGVSKACGSPVILAFLLGLAAGFERVLFLRTGVTSVGHLSVLEMLEQFSWSVPVLCPRSLSLSSSSVAGEQTTFFSCVASW